MEEISTSDGFAEDLSYGANAMREVWWSSQAEFMGSMGYLGRPAGSTSDKALSILKLVFSFSFGLAGQCLLGLSNRFHSREFVYWAGEGILVSPEQVKVMHINACMFQGSLPYHFRKKVPAKERMEMLAQKIETEQPDILFLCEFSQIFSGDLYERI